MIGFRGWGCRGLGFKGLRSSGLGFRGYNKGDNGGYIDPLWLRAVPEFRGLGCRSSGVLGLRGLGVEGFGLGAGLCFGPCRKVLRVYVRP